MSDMGDDFRTFKEFKRERKEDAYRRARPEERLREAGISYTEHNNGTHLVVPTDGTLVDFWPTTGRWIVRGGTCGFGVKALIAFVKGKTQ